MVDDETGTLDDLFCALSHQIDMHAESVPANMAKERNLKAKLIVAELRNWAAQMDNHQEAVMAFLQMITNLKLKSHKRNEQQRSFLKTLFHKSAHLNLLASRAIEKYRLVQEQQSEVQRQMEVLHAIRNIKLDLHLYQFGDDYFELWACKIKDAKKREKEFKQRMNKRLTSQKTN